MAVVSMDGDYGQERMRGGLVFSGLLHVLLLGFAIFGLPYAYRETQPVISIPVEMISEDEVTAMRIDRTPQQEVITPPAETLGVASDEPQVSDAAPPPAPQQSAAAPPAPPVPGPRPEAAARPEPEAPAAAAEAPLPEAAPETTAEPPSQPAAAETPASDEAAEVPPADSAVAEQRAAPSAADTPLPSAAVEAEPEPVAAPSAAETAAAEPEPETQSPLMAETTPPVPQPRPRTQPVQQAEAAPAEPAREATQPATQPQEAARPAEPDQSVQAREEQAEATEDRLASILRNVEQLEPSPQTDQRTERTAEQPPSGGAPPQTLDDRLSAQRIAAMLSEQVARCWRLDAGARQAQELVVPLRVRFNPDGSLIGQPQVVEAGRYSADGYYRSAADNARRALIACSPYTLPISDYGLWQDVVFNFDPREMF